MAMKKPHSHTLEYIISFLMVAFGIAVAWIFMSAWKSGLASQGPQLAIIEMLLIVVLIILAQTVVLIRIYDQH